MGSAHISDSVEKSMMWFMSFKAFEHEISPH